MRLIRRPIIVAALVLVAVMCWELCFTTLQPEATLSGWDANITPVQSESSGWKTKVTPKIWGGPGWQWI